jgi:dihydrofolate synthase/folylpolyglutamate synthase
MFQTFIEVEAYLGSLINFEHTFPLGGARNRPKLQPVLDAIERLGLSRGLPRCAHIAGTVGKGTVAGFLESLLSTRYKTLSFTSPHLISVKERVRLNGQPLDERIWCEGFSDIISKLKNEPEISLTYFESVFVFYLWVSNALNCECHVVETGLGGSFDATNVLENTTAVLTRIDFDHTAILGKTLTMITTDKSGIIKPDSIVVSSSQQPESLSVIKTAAEHMRAKLAVCGTDFTLEERSGRELMYRDSVRTLRGLHLLKNTDYQRENAAVAIFSAFSIGGDLSEDVISKVLSTYFTSARQQILPGIPPILLDTAHNPASFRVLAETLKSQYKDRQIKAVIGMMKDKDARACLESLRGIVEGLLVVSTGNPRSFTPDELCAIAGEAGIRARAYSENKYAYIDLHENPLITLGLVTGSFYVAGDYLKWRGDAGIT